MDDAYIICTSGTTGRQKAIVHTQCSLSASIDALIQWDLEIYSPRDQVVQIASCSWAMHLLEIFPPLVLGTALILLRPGGNLDMAYFTQTLIKRQVNTLTIGLTMARILADYLKISQQVDTFRRVRNLCVTGQFHTLSLILA